jgi:hypothetical protein
MRHNCGSIGYHGDPPGRSLCTSAPGCANALKVSRAAGVDWIVQITI